MGSDEPPRLPNGPLEVLYWPLLTLQIVVTSSVELKTAVIRLRTASLHRYAVDQCHHELFDSIDTPLMKADALTHRFRQILGKVIEVCRCNQFPDTTYVHDSTKTATHCLWQNCSTYLLARYLKELA